MRPRATPTAISPTATAAVKPSSPSATPAAPPAPPAPRNLSLTGDVFAPWNAETAKNAIDGSTDTLWASGQYAPQWFQVALKEPSLVERLELVVTQNPAGPTTHEIYLGGTDGLLNLYKTLDHVDTADGQTLTIPVDPPRVLTRVMVRTTVSPSQVGWREVRVIGVPAAAAGVPIPPKPTPALRPQQIASGFQLPVGIVNAGDGSGRLFVLEQNGRVRVVNRDRTVQAESFLDIQAHVIAGGERGLLGLAFPPGYPQKPYFYMTYNTADPGGSSWKPGDELLVRVHVKPDGRTADMGTQQVLLVDPKPNELHNGGHLEFGPKDGYLYLGLGDGGPNNDPDKRGQNPALIYAKMLRLDVESPPPDGATYVIPPTNPWVGQAGRRPETWAYGLRNPWAYTFDRQTGDLFLGDVGEAEWEEVNFQPASSHGGENYGWSVMEGTHCFKAQTCDQTGLVTPVAEYHHVDGCAIVGGAVAHAPQYPKLDGVFVFSDFCNGRIWGLRRDGDTWRKSILYEFNQPVTAVGLGEDGMIYAAEYSGGNLVELLPAS